MLSSASCNVGQPELGQSPPTCVPALEESGGHWVFLVVTPASPLVATALTCEELWEEPRQPQVGAELALLFL